jgi:MGT family glycosyltransferase
VIQGQHVLFLSFPMHGHVYPTLTIAEELGRRGHRVTYATTETFADEVRRAGVELLRYDDELASIPAGVSPDAGTDEITLTSISFVVQGLHMLVPLVRWPADHPPDLVVCDPLTFAAGAVLSQAWGVPLITTHPNVAFNKEFNWPAELRGQLMEDPVLGPRAVAIETEMAAILADHGLNEERLDRADDLAMVFVPRQLQPHAETFGDNYVFVGPCTDGAVFDGEWRPAGDRPVLFISLGTLYNERPEHLRRFAEAFGQLEWQVVMSVGGSSSTAAGGELPPNFELHEWVPQLSVLEHASVFLTNGGLGGITSALQQGTPMVLVPEAAEQLMHAGQVADLGLGRIVSLADSTPEQLRDAVLAVAADQAMAARADELRAVIRAAGGTRRAADVIEEQLRHA